MKKIYSIIALAAMGVVANAQNLVTNPSFDNGLTGWTAGPTGSYTLPTLAPADGSDGANSATYNASATTGFYQELPITAGHSITISFYYKASGSGNGARIWSAYKNAAGTIVNQTSDPATDPLRTNNGYLPMVSNWTQKTITVTVPANVTTLQLAFRAYSNSTVSFDQISVVDNTSALATAEIKANNTPVLVKNTSAKSNITFGVKANDVKFYNMAGQVVKSASVRAEEVVNVEDLQAGMYIVTGTVNGQPVSQKILKK